MATAMSILGAAALLLACFVLVPALVLLVQIVAASRPRRPSPRESPAARRPPLVVLVPAHDESAGIAATVAGVLAQLDAEDRLLVVADNCSDDTAQRARLAGASVVERHDALRRGKGYALDFGVRVIEAWPVSTDVIIVVVDADCSLEPFALERLARCCQATGRPAQALYLMRSPPGAGLKARMAEFAWLVRNLARPLGAARLGLPCQLMGTGMAFPWVVMRDAPLSSGHLVEDMQLGLRLAERGTAPVFVPEATVASVFPTGDRARQTQRTRWEHGHLALIASELPRLLWRSLASGRPELAAMAADLCVPPLASLVLAIVVACLLGALAALGSSTGLWALLIALVALLAVAIAMLLAWSAFGRRTVTLGELLSAPFYVIAKLPLYARLLGKRQVRWVRTERDKKG